MSKAKFHIGKGDTVEVISGASKGATGTVLRVIADKSQALVEGVRMITKAVKPSQDKQKPSGLLKQEGPIHVSNLKLVAAKESKPAKAKASGAKKPAAEKKPAAKKAAAEKTAAEKKPAAKKAKSAEGNTK